MSRRRQDVLLIDHPVGKRDDRASRMLAERGYRLDWRCPGNGDSCRGTEEGRLLRRHRLRRTGKRQRRPRRPICAKRLDWIEAWVGRDRPFLGICLGAQLLARTLGARVACTTTACTRSATCRSPRRRRATAFLGEEMHVYHWHKEGFELPAGAELLAVGPTFENQAYRLGPTVYGIQFHPEVTPHVLTRWCEEATEMLDFPGAHPPERQKADAERHDPVVEDWLNRFLDRWLAEAQVA